LIELSRFWLYLLYHYNWPLEKILVQIFSSIAFSVLYLKGVIMHRHQTLVYDTLYPPRLNTLFLISKWSIWKARNKVKYDKIHINQNVLWCIVLIYYNYLLIIDRIVKILALSIVSLQLAVRKNFSSDF
jgi:hypothetical protein